MSDIKLSVGTLEKSPVCFPGNGAAKPLECAHNVTPGRYYPIREISRTLPANLGNIGAQIDHIATAENIGTVSCLLSDKCFTIFQNKPPSLQMCN